MLSRIFRDRPRTLPITLYPPKRDIILHLITSLILCWGGFLGLEDNLVIGLCCVTFFGLCIVVFTVQLCSRGDYLRLDYDGFTVCSLHRQHRVDWAMVESFFPYAANGHNMVSWRYRPEYLARSRRQANRSLTQIDGAMPNTYGMKPEKLAALMNELRLCYQLARHYAPSS